MFYNKDKEVIIKNAQSPHKDYCVGYPGQGPYFTGFSMGSSSVPKKFSHEGSFLLDKINAFDRAEINDTYLGQINMITVSSFCGPHGLLWGYDVAYEDSLSINDLLSDDDLKEFRDIEICNGKNLRNATKKLFGTIDDKKFPFFPGSHVFAAEKFISLPGPTTLYGCFAMGIPKERDKYACLFMEDVGVIKKDNNEEKVNLLKNIIRSVEEIGRNQKISYRTVFVDIITQEVKENEVGGVLVVSPYFLLAQNAVHLYKDK